jgi:hypothetical protein
VARAWDVGAEDKGPDRVQDKGPDWELAEVVRRMRRANAVRTQARETIHPASIPREKALISPVRAMAKVEELAEVPVAVWGWAEVSAVVWVEAGGEHSKMVRGRQGEGETRRQGEGVTRCRAGFQARRQARRAELSGIGSTEDTDHL